MCSEPLQARAFGAHSRAAHAQHSAAHNRHHFAARRAQSWVFEKDAWLTMSSLVSAGLARDAIHVLEAEIVGPVRVLARQVERAHTERIREHRVRAPRA